MAGDISLTDERSLLRDSVRRVLAERWTWTDRTACIHARVADRRSLWPLFAALGWLAAGFGEEAGGAGGGIGDVVVIAEELGRALVIEPFAAHVATTALLARLNGDVSATLLDDTLAGTSRGAFVGDRGAVLSAGRLTGVAPFVSGAYVAGRLFVAAREERGEPILLLVSGAAPGVTRAPYRSLDHHIVTDLRFDDVAVPTDAVLATGADARDAIEAAEQAECLAICAETMGIMDAALSATRDYVRLRRQFGAPVGSFQAVRHRVADMLIDCELARSLLCHMNDVWADCDFQVRCRAISAAKIYLGEAGLRVVRSAIQLHGGMGVVEDHPIGQLYKRVYVLARTGGDADDYIDRFSQATDRLLAAGMAL